MSSLLYAKRTEDRVRAKAIDTAEGGKSTKKSLDALAALVPAEALALHAIVIEVTTVTTKAPDGKDVTAITDPGVLRGSFWALLAVALLAFVVPRWTNWTALDFARMVIPPLALVGWLLLQQPSAIQDVAFFADWSDAMKTAVAAFGATGLGVLAAALAYRADVSTAKT